MAVRSDGILAGEIYVSAVVCTFSTVNMGFGTTNSNLFDCLLFSFASRLLSSRPGTACLGSGRKILIAEGS